MKLFNIICAWICLIALATLLVSTLILIWAMPMWIVGKCALTAVLVALVFGCMAVAPIW